MNDNTSIVLAGDYSPLAAGDKLSVPSYAALRKALPRAAGESKAAYADRVEAAHKAHRDSFGLMVAAVNAAAGQQGFAPRRVSVGKSGRGYSVSYVRPAPRKESLRARAARLERELSELRGRMSAIPA